MLLQSPRTTRRQKVLLAGSGLGVDDTASGALAGALRGALGPLRGQTPDLLVLFASAGLSEELPDVLRAAAVESGAHEMAACTGQGVIGNDQEVETRPAIAALALCLPDSSPLSLCHFTADDVASFTSAQDWTRHVGLQPGACTGLVILAEPLSTPVEALIAGLAGAYPGVPIVGGIALGPEPRQPAVLAQGTRLISDGALVIGFSGQVQLLPVVSQGCEPLGEPWTITEADGRVIRTIGNRPATEVLRETLRSLRDDQRARARQNLLVGLAVNEYRDQFGRGDFLIRALVGMDPRTGALAISGEARVGQTIQFQVRDARAADEELRHLLLRAAGSLRAPVAATLLFACNGRGQQLFGRAHHDALTARGLLNRPAVAGFFCGGEIGPVDGQPFLHGFTASLGLLIPRS